VVRRCVLSRLGRGAARGLSLHGRLVAFLRPVRLVVGLLSLIGVVEGDLGLGLEVMRVWIAHLSVDGGGDSSCSLDFEDLIDY